MKFSAYMFIRNGIKAGYTFMEAIENALPFVDEFYVLDGASDDGTLEALCKLQAAAPKVRIESRRPAYLSAPPEAKGHLLGAAFEDARKACRGDWLVQVQADTVFHPVTLYAARAFLERGTNACDYGALEVLRRQYRWNWQEMYRSDNLALIFRKDVGRVLGDGINIGVKGRISRALLPLFSRYPAADSAWVFFENIAGKLSGCSEIWTADWLKKDCRAFPAYDESTGRGFAADLDSYRSSKELPPQWRHTTSPFAGLLPGNLLAHVGAAAYAVPGRMFEPGGLYAPSAEELNAMRAAAAACRRPLREVLLNLIGL